MTTVLWGYQPGRAGDFPPCPCGENHLMGESDGGLHLRLRCWCGATVEGSFDSMEERYEVVARYGG